ncbi:PAS domain-containing protein [Dongia sp. agr-C8]
MSVLDDPALAAIEANDLRSPVTRAGYEYWLRKKGDRAFPARSDFDPLLEQPKLSRNMVLVDVERDPLDFRYRYIGTRVRENMNAEWTGKRMSEIPMQRAPNPIWQHHLWVLEHRMPRFYRPAYLGPFKEFKFIESAQLPLGAEEGEIDMMMVFVDFLRKSAA